MRGIVLVPVGSPTLTNAVHVMLLFFAGGSRRLRTPLSGVGTHTMVQSDMLGVETHRPRPGRGRVLGCGRVLRDRDRVLVFNEKTAGLFIENQNPIAVGIDRGRDRGRIVANDRGH